MTLTYGNGNSVSYVCEPLERVTGVRYNGSSSNALTYTYDPFGKPLTATGTMAAINPLRYRGYYYDTESGLYYLKSRYYDPNICRFINADDASFTGADGEFVSYNLFAYCKDNPINGIDPNGNWNWGGFIAGAGIIAATVLTVATFGIATPVAAVVATAAVTTGAVMAAAAATDSAMVLDFSASAQVTPVEYRKIGVSLIIDYSNDSSSVYLHGGTGRGHSNGISYSCGFVDNYNSPEDYSGSFVDVNAGGKIGLDHCWAPGFKPGKATRATLITFSLNDGLGGGVGYDWYVLVHTM